jgi:hypothetical protein
MPAAFDYINSMVIICSVGVALRCKQIRHKNRLMFDISCLIFNHHSELICKPYQLDIEFL